MASRPRKSDSTGKSWPTSPRRTLLHLLNWSMSQKPRLRPSPARLWQKHNLKFEIEKTGGLKRFARLLLCKKNSVNFVNSVSTLGLAKQIKNEYQKKLVVCSSNCLGNSSGMRNADSQCDSESSAFKITFSTFAIECLS